MLSERVYSISGPEEFTIGEEQEVGWIARHLAGPANLILVAEVDGAVVGRLNFAMEQRGWMAHNVRVGVAVAQG